MFPNSVADGTCIDLHADGSFCHELGVGAWAFTVPCLNLDGSGTAAGSTVARFEFLAVLQGLDAVLAVDSSGLPVHVVSDCDSTVAAINCLREGKPLLAPGRYEDQTDLLPRLVWVLERRIVRVTRYQGGRLYHQACHRTARRRLRAEIAKDPEARHQLALMRQRAHAL